MGKELPPHTFSTSRRILAYLKPYRKEFAIAMICMIIFGASDGGVPFLIKYMLDGIFTQQRRELLYILPGILLVYAVVRAIVDFGQMFLMARIGHYIVRDLRKDVNNHVLKLSPDYFVSNSTAQLLSRITSDVLLVRMLLTECVAALIRDSIRVVALLIASIYLDPLLAILAVLVVPVGVIPVYRFGRRIRRLSKQGQEGIGALSAMMQESMLGNRVVKIFSRENFEKERFDKENERLSQTFIRSEKARALMGPVNEILGAVAISGILLYGGISVMNGSRSQGDFIAFLIAVFLMYDPFKKLSRLNTVIQQGVAGADRIFEILDFKPSIVDPVSPLPMSKQNSLDFVQVDFVYPGSEQAALHEIAISIKEGEKVALVGFSGAGKSTFVDLIPRFIDPSRGTVKVGGVDVSKVKLSDLRERIALVGQHTFLFNDTVFNNISYGLSSASREQVYEAARAAYAFDFITQLPQGFDTVIGESGLTLSGGERQRIAIARAILKNAPILILDEATASLDNRSEREVQSAIETLQQGRTSVIIAHRLSTVRNVDRIIVLKDGSIVEVGSHDELIARGQEYAKLHELQFRDKEEKPDIDEALIN